MEIDLTVLFAIIFIGGLIGMGYMHEEVHVQIYKSYGIESYIDLISYFPDGMTIAESPCPNETCELAHNINDVVAYHLTAFYVMIGFGILFLIILNEKK